MSEKTTMYQVAMECTNCGWDGNVEIRKGTTVDSFLYRGPDDKIPAPTCPDCHCPTIQKKAPIDYNPKFPGLGMMPCSISINGDDITSNITTALPKMSE